MDHSRAGLTKGAGRAAALPNFEQPTTPIVKLPYLIFIPSAGPAQGRAICFDSATSLILHLKAPAPSFLGSLTVEKEQAQGIP